MIPQLLGRRVATYCAVIVMAVALVAILAGCGGSALADVSRVGDGASVPVASACQVDDPRPGAWDCYPTLAPIYPRVFSYSEWRAQTPISIATEDEVFVALVEAGIPHREASVLARAAVSCESPVRDNRDGKSIGALLSATGDGGASRGPLQVHVGYNPWASGMALSDLPTAARAAAIIYHDGGVKRWSCAQ